MAYESKKSHAALKKNRIFSAFFLVSVDVLVMESLLCPCCMPPSLHSPEPCEGFSLTHPTGERTRVLYLRLHIFTFECLLESVMPVTSRVL